VVYEQSGNAQKSRTNDVVRCERCVALVRTVYQKTNDVVYPSPFLAKLQEEHLRIAEAMTSKMYRSVLRIPEAVEFDFDQFLFYGTENIGLNPDKTLPENRHRNKELNDYYLNLLLQRPSSTMLQISYLDWTSLPVQIGGYRLSVGHIATGLWIFDFVTELRRLPSAVLSWFLPSKPVDEKDTAVALAKMPPLSR
jgi:hypothetical protein